MASIGSGYDLDVVTYSPEGRVFQIEYASKAVEHSSTTLALKVDGAVIFVTDKTLNNKMALPTSNPRVLAVAPHAAMTFAGLAADATCLAEAGRDEARDFRNIYAEVIPTSVLAKRVGAQMHQFVAQSSSFSRPFGVALLLGGIVEGNAELYLIEPSGAVSRCFAYSLGKHAHLARSRLETALLPSVEGMTVEQATRAAAKLITSLHDDTRDKPMILEVSVLNGDGLKRMDAAEAAALHAELKAEIENEEN